MSTQTAHPGTTGRYASGSDLGRGVLAGLLILARLVPQFHALTMTNQPLELAVHLVFGSLRALLVMAGGDRRVSPSDRAVLPGRRLVPSDE